MGIENTNYTENFNVNLASVVTLISAHVQQSGSTRVCVCVCECVCVCVCVVCVCVCGRVVAYLTSSLAHFTLCAHI